MRKRVMSWVLTAVMLLSTFSAFPLNAAAEPDPTYVCQVGGTQYETLDDGLSVVTDGGTVTLLEDITYSDTIIANMKTVTIDLNGCDLTIEGVDGHGLWSFSGGSLTIKDLPGGAEGGKLTVNSLGGRDSYDREKYCAFAESGGTIDVAGTFSSLYPGSGDTSGVIALFATGSGSSITLTGSAVGYAAGAYSINDATITVNGSVEGSYYGAFCAYGGTLDITGDVTAGARGLTADYGGVATVVGDVTGGTGVDSSNSEFFSDSVIDITGDVTATGADPGTAAVNVSWGADVDIDGSLFADPDNGYGIVASDTANVAVTGNITAKNGVMMSYSNATATVGGDIISNDGIGININCGGTTTVNGKITGAVSYIQLNGVGFNPEDNTSQAGGYNVYAHELTNEYGTYLSTARVRIAQPSVCEVDGVEYATLDAGLAAAAAIEDTVTLLTDISYVGPLTVTYNTYIFLNGHTLNIVNDAGEGLISNGHNFSFSGEGEVNVTGTTYGVYVTGSGNVEVTNATATQAMGTAVNVTDTTGSVTVYGNATANQSDSTGILSRGNAVVYKNVSATGLNSVGANAQSGGNIRILGDITAPNYVYVGASYITQSEYTSDTEGYYHYSQLGSNVSVKHTVCAIGATEYKWLADALGAAADGDTITLLADIRYEGEIVLTEKDLHLDLGAHTLDIGRTGSDGALIVDGGMLTIDDTDGGELNIVDGYIGVWVLNDATATVTSISGLNGYGIVGESGGSVRVKEGISVLSYMGKGLTLGGGATAHVLGDIYSLDGILVSGDGSAAVIDGSISATSGDGVKAHSNGTVTVKGDVVGQYRGVSAYGWDDGGGNVHVYGDVTGSNDFGVEASAGSQVVIDGNVQSKKGLSAYGEGTCVTVYGGTTSTGADEHGATADTGGLITVNGSITASNFALIGTTTMAQAEGVLDGRYTLYTDGESTVRVKGIEFYTEDFEDGTIAGWAQSAVGWSVTNSLFNPTTTPHSGSYVAMFSSYSLGAGASSNFFQTQPVNLSKGTDYKLEFWMYHDNEWASSDDCVTVQISTDGGSSWTELGTFDRYSVTNGWTKETVALTPYVGQSDVRIGFLGQPAFGNNIFIDDITVSHVCIIDGCSATEAYGGYVASREIEGETYYHVSTPEQLAHISEHMDLNFIQTGDIDLASYNGGKWVPIGGYGDPENYSTPDYFTGKYLGNGHEIQNLYFYFNDPAVSSCHAGLFAWVSGAGSLISDLTVKVSGAQLTCYNYPDFGAIASTLEGGIIKDCDVVIQGDVVTSLPNGDAGGIAATALTSDGAGAIEGCTVTLQSGSIEAAGWHKSTGGIVGNAYIPITDCHVVINTGEYIRSTFVGGIVGRYGKNNTISGCTVTGGGSLKLAPQGYYETYVGGIAGWSSEATVQSCVNEVTVDATGLTMIPFGESAYAGGIAGYLSSGSTVLGCDNAGDVNLTIENSVVDDYGHTVTPNGDEYAYAGGIAGFINGYSRASTIENCQNNANVISVNRISANRAYAGGIVGHIESGELSEGRMSAAPGVTVTNCANIGGDKKVEAKAATTLTGGIAGSSTFADFETPNIIIENCYNRSSVYSERTGSPKKETMCIGVTAGGIVGAAREITVISCYSTAPDVQAVSGDEGDAYYGGVAGLIYDTAYTQTYYETNANVTKAAGGIVSGMDIVAQSDVAGSYQGATAQNLKTKSFYGSAWKWYTDGGAAPDFYSASTPWRMTSATSYPALRGAAYTTSNPPSGGGGGSAVITYTVMAKAGAGGSISPSGSVRVDKLASQTFTVKPDTGYRITDVLVDGKSIGAVSGYTFEKVKANHTIEAKFEKVRLSAQFTDVDPALWYAQGIEFALERGLFKGVTDTTFEPDTAMTRAMLVTVLHRLAGNPAAKLSDLFADVEKGSWFEEAVRWASEGGVIQGFDAATFGPGILLTREQLAVILFRYAALSGYDTAARTDLSVYSDVALVSPWAVEAMQWAVAEGLITGTAGDTLDAGGAANRAQVATIVMRFVRTVAK